MNPSESVKGRLWDIREAATTALAFIKGKRYYDYSRSKLLQSAVERQLMIAGEAARVLPQSYKVKVPHVNWKLLNGLRNIIVHEYGDIRHEVIWAITKHKLPVIAGQIGELLEKEE